MTARMDFPVGTRVELSPATDAWMQGDRYGEVVGYGKRVYGGYEAQPIRVKLDKSGRVRRFPVALLSRINPPTPKARRFVAAKIRKLRREGKPERAAVGEALAIGRRRGFRSIPKRPRKNPAAYSELEAWREVQYRARAILKRGANTVGGATFTDAAYLDTLADHMRAQLARGVHANPRRRPNPVMGLIANESPAVFTVSKRVKEIVYIHAQDGEEYVHPFAPGVSATFLQDGRCVLWRRDGKPVGGRRIGNTIRPIGG